MNGGTKISSKAKSLEDRVIEMRAEEACRLRDELERNWAKADHTPPLKIKSGPNKTRSSFAHAARTKITDKFVPVDFTSDNDINFLPIGVPTLFDRQPVLSIKNILEYLVIRKEGKRECLVGRGFTKCCREDAKCDNKRCAKCWALGQRRIKGVAYVVREVIDGSTPKIVDPHGVDPKGKRARGKDLDSATRARFRLTSSQSHYKYQNSEWE